MRKSCPGSYVVLDPRVHLASTFVVYASLLLAWAILRLLRIQAIHPQRIFHWVIATLTPVAAILFMLNVHAKDIGIRTCDLGSFFHVFVLLVDIVFFVRLVVEILEGHPPDLIPSMTDGWLLVNTVWKIVKNAAINEYHFLVLLRLLYPQTLEMYAMLITRRFGVPEKRTMFQLGFIIVGVFVFAGALQTAEEWSQLLGIHSDASGEVTAWHSYWDYIYMGFVTMSTVGYGDMTPSTVAGQVIVVIGIVVCLNWFAGSCEALYHVVEGTVVNIAGYVPPLPRQRRVVVVGCIKTDKMQQLVDELSAQKETQIIVGIGKEESLHLREAQGVFVVRDDLNRSFFRRCFPKVETEDHHPSYTLMVLNQESDVDEVEDRNSDMHVLSLVQMVKTDMPDVRVVAQVLWQKTRVTMRHLGGWRRDTDQILCTEEVVGNLMAQTVAADGAASILATFITTPLTSIPPVVHPCTDQVTCAHIWGQGLVLALSDCKFKQSETFEQAALQYYMLDRVLLLGYVEKESKSGAQKPGKLLPSSLPRKARRVLLVPPDLVSPEGTVTLPHDANLKPSSPGLPSPDLYTKDKTVWVVSDGSEGAFTKDVWRRNLRVVLEHDTKTRIDVAALLEPQQESSMAVYNYYSAKAYLAETSPWAHLVSNVEHGTQPGVWKVSGECPHASTSYVNPSIVTSAARLACHSNILFPLWMSLVQNCRVVEMKLEGYYYYGEIFQYLLTQRKMLAVGATILMMNHSRDACIQALSLDPDDEGRLAITNPKYDFCLHPGDKMVAFPLN